MSDLPLTPGKLPPALLSELLADAPALPAEVLLGPKAGEDAAAIRVPGGVLVAATDPITLTGSDVGAYAVVINANDVAVMGVRPRWFLAAVLLPDGTPVSAVRALFDGMHAACAEAGVCLVGGHTEVTSAVQQPVVVGQMLGIAEDGHFLTTGGVRAGDRVVQIGAAPVEGAAVFASEAAEALAELPRDVLDRALNATSDPGISVVDAALACASLGASALHDPTEGGLAGGLHELSAASGLSLVVDAEEVLWFEPGVRICRAVGADPWGTLASGALLAAFPEERLDAALVELARQGRQARTIASARQAARSGAAVALAGGGALPHFERDEVARILHP